MRDSASPPAAENSAAAEFLAGGGIMGAAMRAHDWSRSDLGPPQQWPPSLRTAVSIMLNSGHPMFLAWGPQLNFLFNDAYRPILGAKLTDALAAPFAELWWDIWDAIGPMAERALAGEATWFENQKLVMQRHGYPEETYFNFSYSPIHDEHGLVAGIFCACTETTETVLATRQLRSAERALREANEDLQIEREAVRAANRQLRAETEHLRRLFEQAPSFMAIVRGPDHVIELVNNSYLQLVGHRDIVGRRLLDALPEVAGQGFVELLDQVYASGEAFVGKQQPISLQRDRHGPAEQRFVDFVYQPILDAKGAVAGIFVEGSDVTERVLAEQELRRLTETLEEQVEARTRDLRRAEEALRQSQKMEAVGQLTGGIAHDFNNLLLGISGSLTLAERRIAAGRPDEVGRFLGLAAKSADRAAALTHRLLAFSRRQPLDPRAVRGNELVASTEELLRRTVGEAIELRLALEPRLWLTRCDPNQLESALLNLVINARDAMAGGGKLILSTANISVDAARAAAIGEAEAGDYVRFAVADSGAGMTREVIARAFDPFFTTKPLGRGTGLGLSMIYGFVRQSGGFVSIDSTPGAGTTVELYLPRSGDAAEDAAPAAPVRRVQVPATGEVVLVVEDEGTVRELIVDVLNGLGYRVLEARDGAAGLQILQSSAPVDLLVTDIGLPGLNGRQLVDAARELRPDLKVLFMTGYAETAAAADGFLQPGMELLTKPFAMDALAARVRELITPPGD